MTESKDPGSSRGARPANEGSARLLVVEDEEHLAAGLKLNFELEGYVVDVGSDAREAARLLASHEAYSAIVLDVMLPDLDGFSLCRRIREAGNYTPVIMLTARSNHSDRVAGLEAGADDYMVKPFDLGELLARVGSALRRRRWEKTGQSEGVKEILRFGNAEVDLASHRASVRGEKIDLTRLEVDLLRYFSQNPSRTLSRRELLEKVWNLRGYSNTRSVDNFIARLRRYFERDPSYPVYFQSVRGVGYRFEPDPEKDGGERGES